MAGKLKGSFEIARSWSRGVLALAALALACLGTACSGGGSTNPGASGGQLSYAGPANWTISGPQGGPFANRSMDIVIENHSLGPIDWSAVSIPYFVLLDLTSGTVPANSQVSVHASLDPTLAGSLPVGNTSGVLAFHNDTAPQSDLSIDTVLSVSPPGVSILLDPATNFASTGPAGGPFTPPSTGYTITNTGSANLSWQASVGAAWITVQPPSGQLAPGAVVNVLVAIDDASTSALSPSTYWSFFDIVDTSSSATLDTRTVSITVTQSAPQGGWTTFTPSVDTRTIYVSSSIGNDSNDGLTVSTPKRTVGAGRALLRDGYPDWLLLKKGDTFDYVFGSWSLSGRSLSERMLLSSYGTGARPLIRTGTATGIYTAGGTNPNHIAIVGLHFFAHTYTGGNGNPRAINWVGGTQNLLIEDCYIQAYETNVVVQGYPVPLRHSNVAIRRNVIVDAYNTGSSNSEGFYADRVDGMLIEGNVFDHNGWIDSVPGSLPTIFRRNVYVQNGCTAVSFIGNVVAGTDGAQIRCGGVVTDNFVARCVVGLHVGVGNSPEPGGVMATLSRNVVIDGANQDASNPAIFGLRASNLAGGEIADNIVANAQVQYDARSLWLCTISGYAGPIAQNVDIARNILHNAGRIDANGQAWQYGNTDIHDCVIQGPPNQWQDGIATFQDPGVLVSSVFGGAHNTWSLTGQPQSAWFKVAGAPMSLAVYLLAINDTTSSAGPVNFPDANRNLGTYNSSLGGSATYAAFMAECRLQSKENWRVPYTAESINTYIRVGFGL